jgi:hypothetical protein
VRKVEFLIRNVTHLKGSRSFMRLKEDEMVLELPVEIWFITLHGIKA